MPKGAGMASRASWRQGPLDRQHLAARPPRTAVGASLSEVRFTGKINLRAKPDVAMIEAVHGALGCAPPVEPGTTARSDSCTILWIGPTEWLVIVPPGAEAATLSSLEDALAGQHAAVNDVGEGLHVIRLSGPDSRLVLAKGCPLDLHPRVFGPGRCARSIVAKATVLVHQLDDSPSFDLYVDRTFAEYLWRWLEDAASTLAGIK